MLGLKYPIIQAPMAGISTVELAASITNLGGLGSIPLAAVDLRKKSGVQDISNQLDIFKSLVGSPDLRRNVNLNFFCQDRKIQEVEPTEQQIFKWREIFTDSFKTDLSEIELPISNISFQEIEENHSENIQALISLLLEYKPKVVSFHFGIPSQSTIDALQSNGTTVFVSVTSLSEADLAVSHGVKGLVLQGYEAGGHRGNFLVSSELDENLSTSILTRQVLEKFGGADNGILIVPAGGIVNGKDIDYYLRLGVSGVQLGTAFLDTKESNSNGFISKNKGLPTIMTLLISGKTARTLRTPFIERVLQKAGTTESKDLPPYGYSYSGYKSTLKLVGDTNNGFYLAGQGYQWIKGNNVEAGVVFNELIKDL